MTVAAAERREKTPARPAVRRRRVWFGLLALGLLLLAVTVTVLYRTVPKGDEGTGPVDALVVLGTPAGLHGELNPMQVWRVEEAVREWRRGRAPRVIFTGGPTANQYVEAAVMANYARTLGLPEGAILEERRSHTTLQNIDNMTQIMRAHGWNSVEVVSSRQHLPRAAVILEWTGLRWRVHAAPTPGLPRVQAATAWVEEAVGTAVMRVFRRHGEPVLHAVAKTQYAMAYGIRWVVYRVEGWMER